MKLCEHPPLHLTYCLSIHPGESWAENLRAIREKALVVRDAVAGGRALGLGLRLGRQAADELSRPAAMEEFKQLLAAENLYVFTINGFPYGRFHGEAVKENVYRPDWRTHERREYTLALADLLAALLPEGVNGSISTVPLSYKSWVRSEDDMAAMTASLADVALHLSELRSRKGRQICLAIEPEPDCCLGNTQEAIEFFSGPMQTFGSAHLRKLGLSAAQGEEIIRQHLGVCLDTVHAAVEFEDPAESLASLISAGIAVPKIQLGAALCADADPPTRRRLRDFCDEVYLHQVRVRLADGSIRRYSDLPVALDEAGSGDGAGQWRIHFHVPLFFERNGGLESSSSLLQGRFAEAIAAGATEHLEIETYTFDVLPDELRPGDVTDCITGEYRWVMENLFAKNAKMPEAAEADG